MKSSKEWRRIAERHKALNIDNKKPDTISNYFYSLFSELADLTEEVEALKRQQNPTPSTEKQ